jgi:hypothetical protein
MHAPINVFAEAVGDQGGACEGQDQLDLLFVRQSKDWQSSFSNFGSRFGSRFRVMFLFNGGSRCGGRLCEGLVEQLERGEGYALLVAFDAEDQGDGFEGVRGQVIGELEGEDGGGGVHLLFAELLDVLEESFDESVDETKEQQDDIALSSLKGEPQFLQTEERQTQEVLVATCEIPDFEQVTV